MKIELIERSNLDWIDLKNRRLKIRCFRDRQEHKNG